MQPAVVEILPGALFGAVGRQGNSSTITTTSAEGLLIYSSTSVGAAKDASYDGPEKAEAKCVP